MSGHTRSWTALIGTAALAIAASVSVTSEAAEGDDLRPPLVDMKEHVDKDGIVAIRLPRHWKQVGKNPTFCSITEFSGFIQPPPPNTEPDLRIEFRHVPAFAHPRLAQFMLPKDEFGTTRVADSLASGDDWVEEMRDRPDPNDPTLGRYRFRQHDGQVLLIRAYCHEKIYPHITKHIDHLLGTIEFRKPAPDLGMPDGFEMHEMDGFEVWTDGAAKSTLKSVVKQVKTTFGYLDDILTGEPRETRPVRLIVCKERAPYAELQQLFSQGVGWETTFVERHRRAIVVSESAMKKRKTVFAGDLAFHAAIARTRQHFGGPVPHWLEFGYGIHARMLHLAKGKLKPPSRELKKTKYAIDERQSTLADLFAIDPRAIEVDDLEATNFELWAWHWYLTIGPGKSLYGATYREHLEVLRETGDPAEARKVWDDTDLDGLRDEFVSWAKTWK